MVRDGGTCSNVLKEEETMSILFGKDLHKFSCDGFDGSKKERHIFTDIFYGGTLKDESNSCTISGSSSSVRDGFGGSSRKDCNNLNLEKSYISSNYSLKGSLMHPKILSHSECLLPSSRALNSKNCSSSSGVLDQGSREHCCSYPWEKNKPINSDTQSYKLFSLRIVESLAHGILSSYYSVQPGSMDVDSDIVDHVTLNYKGLLHPIGENNVGMEANFVTSPVSQESIASGLLKGRSTLEGKVNSGVAAGVDRSVLESIKRHPSALQTIKKHPCGVHYRRVTNKDMPGRLESYAHNLLIDAGWIIESRVRTGRNKMTYLFRKPDKGLVRSSLTSAWKTCGDILLHTEADRDDMGREWSDLNEFWGDLKDTFEYIDMETQQQESNLSLLGRWQLLDPFLAVVFISRKISVLRMGKLVRAVRSATIIPDCSEDIGGVNINGSRKRKSELLSSTCNLTEKQSLVPSLTASPNNYGHDSPFSSDLENEWPSWHALKMLAVNEQLETSNHKLESKSGDERSGLSLKENLDHGSSLGRSTKVSLHIGRDDTFSSKEASSVAVLNDLFIEAQKSKKISDTEETVVTTGTRKLRSEGKHSENSAYLLYENYSNLPDFPCHETSDILTSECLERTVCQKSQSGNVLSISEDENSHTSEILEACSTTKLCKKNLTLDSIEARNFNKDSKGNPLTILVEKPTINFSSLTEGQEDRLPDKFMDVEHNANLSSSGKQSPLGSFCKPLSIISENPYQSPSTKESILTPYHGNILNSSSAQDSREEVLSSIDGPCPGSVRSRKVGKSNESDDQKRSRKRRPRGFYVNDNDLLIAAIIKKKDFCTSSKKFCSKPENSQPEAVRKQKGRRRGWRLQPRGTGNDEKLMTDGKQVVIGARTVLSWLIHMGAVSLRDVVQFHSAKNHEVIKDGWVTRDGILCKCCTQIFSVSEFKAHAGFRQQKPSNLYLESGKSLTLCQLKAWSAEYKLRKGRLKAINDVEVDQNDDTCGICADGGELICCDNCPSTYHQSCLPAQELPEGSWYCFNCICKICNNLACKKEDSSFLAVLECSQCKHRYHGACISENVAHNRNVGSGTWFCGENCKKVFLGLRTRVGMLNFIGDGLSWTILRCNHDDQNVSSPLKIALMAECNSKLAIALSLMEECFLPMVDPRTGIDMVPHVLYNWGSDFARLNFEGFYTIILEKGDTLISVASVRVHGVKVAEIPLIATCGLQRRQKMCTRLLNSIEMMFRSFKVEMIILSAVPSLVETWISGFGFSVINAEEKKLLHGVNLMLLPGSVMLQKKLCEASTPQAGGNDQLHSTLDESQTLAGFNGTKYVDEEHQPAADWDMETNVKLTLSNSANVEQQFCENIPVDVFLEPLLQEPRF